MTKTDLTNARPFAHPEDGDDVIMGRAARRAFVNSFNNVKDVSIGRVTTNGTNLIDGVYFTGTVATAYGVARLGGLTVFSLGGADFVAVFI